MYAKLKTTYNISKALNYNEQKLEQGKAECLLAGNFAKDLGHLTVQDKLERFEQRNSLNEWVQCNVIRVALTFDTAEKISNEQMQMLAKQYMSGMDLGRQPYLLYRHHDTAHPHGHIISTSIRADGSRIEIDRPFLRASHRLTREMEIKYDLRPLTRATRAEEETFKVTHAQRVIPGQSGLKHAISDVLNTVVGHYKYTSLDELNAGLRLYNVVANRGDEQSHLYQHRGLLYHALDENGNHAGRALKASSFLCKPTLANLEKEFSLNESLRNEQAPRVKTAIDWTLAVHPPDWDGFQEELQKEGISVVLLKDKQEREHIYYVDHQTQCIHSGENLGIQYDLSAIQERCLQHQIKDDEDESQRHRLHLDL